MRGRTRRRDGCALGGLAVVLAVLSTLTSASAVAAVRAQTDRPPRAVPARLRVVEAPRSGATIGGADAITVRFSAPLAAHSRLPELVPAVAGHWRLLHPAEAVFYPDGALAPYRHLELVLPSGRNGITARGGAHLLATRDRSLQVAGPSFGRIEQLLAGLGYLPLSFRARTAQPRTDIVDQRLDAFHLPAGSYTWRWSPPPTLRAAWTPGRPCLVATGALYTFESDHGLALTSSLSPALWSALLGAELARRADTDRHGYTYALANKAEPETLRVWHNGRLLLQTLANTGIPAAPTQDGTFPVYEKLTFQIMRGTNPSGQPYADPVHWINYFNGSDAVHEFERASYGYPQSLGCVEIPNAPAEEIYPYMVLGTLVTVAG